MKVYIVQERTLCGEDIQCVTASIGSTLESAYKMCIIEAMEASEYYKQSGSKPSSIWWYAIFEFEVDSMNWSQNSAIKLFSWDGREIEGQPLDGYDKPMVTKEEVIRRIKSKGSAF